MTPGGWEALGETVYAGTRGGLIAFTKSLAREMAPHHINVNCVCPGPTDTPLFASLPEKVRDGLIRAIPFRRLTNPAEIADAVLFFASDYSDYITGQVPQGQRRTDRGRLTWSSGPDWRRHLLLR